MADTRTKEVNFGFYCKYCLDLIRNEDEEDCNSCLAEPVAIDSHRPLYFKQDPNKPDAVEEAKKIAEYKSDLDER